MSSYLAQLSMVGNRKVTPLRRPIPNLAQPYDVFVCIAGVAFGRPASIVSDPRDVRNRIRLIFHTLNRKFEPFLLSSSTNFPQPERATSQRQTL
jgi:hypothetical protein